MTFCTGCLTDRNPYTTHTTTGLVSFRIFGFLYPPYIIYICRQLHVLYIMPENENTPIPEGINQHIKKIRPSPSSPPRNFISTTAPSSSLLWCRKVTFFLSKSAAQRHNHLYVLLYSKINHLLLVLLHSRSLYHSTSAG